MSVEPQNFEELKKLLALKRHEQPAPGFFSELSETIHDRLQHPVPEPAQTWWERLRGDIDVKACAVGVAVCGLVLYAILTAMGRPPKPVFLVDEKPATLTPPSVLIVKPPPMQPTPHTDEIPAALTPVSDPGHSNLPAPPFPNRK
jgi:hypothetical protein